MPVERRQLGGGRCDAHRLRVHVCCWPNGSGHTKSGALLFPAGTRVFGGSIWQDGRKGKAPCRGSRRPASACAGSRCSQCQEQGREASTRPVRRCSDKASYGREEACPEWLGCIQARRVWPRHLRQPCDGSRCQRSRRSKYDEVSGQSDIPQPQTHFTLICATTACHSRWGQSFRVVLCLAVCELASRQTPLAQARCSL